MKPTHLQCIGGDNLLLNMKLEKVLENLNSFEKNSFLKIINDILSENPKNNAEVDKILGEFSNDIKSIDNVNIARVFMLIQDEFARYIQRKFENTASQLDIMLDIVVRDGNCIMKQDWFSRLYDAELKHIKKKVKELEASFADAKSLISPDRKRDYQIYRECLRTAYTNDDAQNVDRKITHDEHTILHTLSNELELSREEVKFINYSILPIRKQPVEEVIGELKNVGVVFYSKKYSTIYVADEVVRVLRGVRGKEIADKFFRRVLRALREPQINLICKKHGIDRKQDYELKIREIINEGISFSGVLRNDVHREGTSATDRKRMVNEIWNKGLGKEAALKGTTIEDKISNIIDHFDQVERDDKVGISVDGYEQLLTDLGESLKKLNLFVKREFELQDENVLSSDLLLDYNIKPRDILDIIPQVDLQKFCEKLGIKTRGDLVLNTLDAYKDSDNLYLENYVNVAYRNLSELKENGIKIKDAEIGIKFEELTKTIFERLGFHVDEELRKKLNTKNDKIDIVLNIGNDDIILVECKSVKEKGYNKFSSVSRQLKAYTKLAKLNDYKVIKSLLVAPDFSDEFVNECELEYELNLSLIPASSMINILEGFKTSKHKELPYKLLMRDVVIQEDRIIKAISK